MLLKLKSTGALVEACSLKDLTDPCKNSVLVRSLKGYRESVAKLTDKSDLVFVSGEDLPGCWMRVIAVKSRLDAPIAKFA